MSTSRRQQIQDNLQNAAQINPEATKPAQFQSGTTEGVALNNFTVKALNSVNNFLTGAAQSFVNTKIEEDYLDGQIKRHQGVAFEDLPGKGRNKFLNEGWRVVDANNTLQSMFTELQNEVESKHFKISPEEFRPLTTQFLTDKLDGLDGPTASLVKEGINKYLPTILTKQLNLYDQESKKNAGLSINESIKNIPLSISTADLQDALAGPEGIKALTGNLYETEQEQAVLNAVVQRLGLNEDGVDFFDKFKSTEYGKNIYDSLDADTKIELSNFKTTRVQQLSQKISQESQKDIQAATEDYLRLDNNMTGEQYLSTIFAIFEDKGVALKNLSPTIKNAFSKVVDKKETALEEILLEEVKVFNTIENFDVDNFVDPLAALINPDNPVASVAQLKEGFKNKKIKGLDRADSRMSVAIALTKPGITEEELNNWVEQKMPRGDIQEYVSSVFDKNTGQAVKYVDEALISLQIEAKDVAQQNALNSALEYSDIVMPAQTKYLNNEISEKEFIATSKDALNIDSLKITPEMYKFVSSSVNRKGQIVRENRNKERATRLSGNIDNIISETKTLIDAEFVATAFPDVEVINNIRDNAKQRIVEAYKQSGLNPNIINKAVGEVRLSNLVSSATNKKALNVATFMGMNSVMSKTGAWPTTIDSSGKKEISNTKLLDSFVIDAAQKYSVENAALLEGGASSEELVNPLAEAILSTRYIPTEFTTSAGIQDVFNSQRPEGVTDTQKMFIASRVGTYMELMNKNPALAKKFGNHLDRAYMDLILERRERGDVTAKEEGFNEAIDIVASLATEINKVNFEESISVIDETVDNKLKDYSISGNSLSHIKYAVTNMVIKSQLRNGNINSKLEEKLAVQSIKNYMADNVHIINSYGEESVFVESDPNSTILSRMYGEKAHLYKPKHIDNDLTSFMFNKGDKDLKNVLTEKNKFWSSVWPGGENTEGVGGYLGQAFGATSRPVRFTYNSENGKIIARISKAFEDEQGMDMIFDIDDVRKYIAERDYVGKEEKIRRAQNLAHIRLTGLPLSHFNQEDTEENLSESFTTGPIFPILSRNK